MYYPRAVRVSLIPSQEREIARALVDSDARIPSVVPPPSIRNMNECVQYHKDRAETIRQMLIDRTERNNGW